MESCGDSYRVSSGEHTHLSGVNRNNFGATLKRTRKELDRLRRNRDVLDAQITKLEQIEAALKGVAEPRRIATNLASITEVVRTAIQGARHPLTPTELRDEVLAMGFDIRKYSQFLASLHVILKRLVKNGEVREFTFADTKKYWWALSLMPPGPLPENAMLGNYYNSYKDSGSQDRADVSRGEREGSREIPAVIRGANARSEWKGHVTATKGGRVRYVPLTERLREVLKQSRSLKSRRVVCDKKGAGLTQKEVQVLMRRVGR
jgi:hypothetical protein